MSKALQERGFESLPSSTKTNTRDQVKSISTAIEVDSHPIRRIRSTQYAVPTRHETRQTTIPFPSCLNGYYCDGKKGSYGPQFLKAYFEASQSITQKEKDPRRYQSALDPWKTILSTARAKIDVYKRKITLRVGEENIIFKSVKPASSLIKRVYMQSLRERIELDLEARLIRGETYGVNRFI
ncbi:hypothetical protein Tco_0348936 [Tanacetum coccineum]